MSTEEVPVPPQWQPQPLYDFRHSADGPRGYKVGITKTGRAGSKRKLDEYSEQVEREEAELAMQDGDANPAVGSVKRPKHNTIGVGKTSGRPWKQPTTKIVRTGQSTSWDKKMKLKAEKDNFIARKREATEARKEAAREERERREEAKRRKEENRKKSAITTKISAATARKMAKNKKLKKKLVVVDG